MSETEKPAEPPKMIRVRAIVAKDTPWRGPFHNGKPMLHGEEAIVPEDEALRMDENRQVMIVGDA